MSESHVTEKSDFAGLMEALTSGVAEIAGLDVADYAPGVIECIYRDTISLVEQNSDLAVDPHSERLLKFASSILAAYRNFEAVVADGDVRLELMKKAVCGYFEPDIKNYIKVRFDIEYQKPEEAFDMATKNFISKGLGKGFIYNEDLKTGSEVTFGIPKCFFLNFFNSNDASEVTKIMCVVDTVWARELNEGSYNIQFDRPTVMSEGADRCRFRFQKIKVTPID